MPSPATATAKPPPKPSVQFQDVDEARGVPRKRVVSDEHWRKDRSSPRSNGQSPNKDASSAKVNKSGPGSGWANTRADAWVRKKSDGAKTTRRKSDAAPDVAKVTNITPGKRRAGVEEDLHSVGSQAGSSKARRDHSMPDVSLPDEDARPNADDTGDKKKEIDGLAQPSSAEGATNAASPPINASKTKNEPAGTPRDSGIQNRSKRKRKSTRPTNAPTPPHKNQGHAASQESSNPLSAFDKRIESWLTTTPDPFVDDGKQSFDATPASQLENLEAEYQSPSPALRITTYRVNGDVIEASGRGRLRPSPLDRFRQSKSASSSPTNDQPPSPTLHRRGAQRGVSPTKRQSPEPVHSSPTNRKSTEHSKTSPRDDSERDGKEFGRGKHKSGTHGRQNSTVEPVDNFGARRSGLFGVSKSTEQEKPSTRVMDSETKRERPKIKRKLTSHADLMSVLSLPEQNQQTIVSARSIRTVRSKLDTATMTDLMNELRADEVKYFRELRTLVDGVIPVLLSCVVSKSQSAVAAGLFNNKNEANATSTIVNIGVVLERLKSSHKRIPMDDSAAFRSWAQGAHRVYSDYLRVWRMGFQDVVVNLAPAKDSDASTGTQQSSLDDALPKDSEGYIVNGDGEKVDVAFLLRRPLVRLKYLTKTLKGIQHLHRSEQMETLVHDFDDLVSKARQRQDEERARLEDESAASIDTTRAREPQTLAPLAGVAIEPSRCVKARDSFDMTLAHSSGQHYDCRVELILREEPDKRTGITEVLFCEVGSSSKWLLFPPFSLKQLSARRGSKAAEVIVMIRGDLTNGQQWYEVMSLTSGSDDTALDWVDMLGSSPIPPEVGRQTHRWAGWPKTKADRSSAVLPLTSESLAAVNASQVDIPIGEQASQLSKRWEEKSPARSPHLFDRGTQPVSVPASGASFHEASSGPTRMTQLHQFKSSTGVSYNEQNHLRAGKDYDEQRRMRSAPQSPFASTLPERKAVPVYSADNRDGNTNPRNNAPFSRNQRARDDAGVGYDSFAASSGNQSPPQRPPLVRRMSPVPTAANPAIPRVRDFQTETDQLGRQTGSPSQNTRDHASNSPNTPSKESQQIHQLAMASPKTPSRGSPKNSPSPQWSSASPLTKQRRRSSSPLKHEYAPSSASNSSTKSAILSDVEGSVTSESSAEDLGPGQIPPLDLLNQKSRSKPSYSDRKNPQDSLSPSNSASQAPYRAVPEPAESGPKLIASIFYWSEKGIWESMHPDECSITVSPGLIEAFEMSAAHSKPWIGKSTATDESKPQPLVAQELTPLVPLRRGTAIDISIRSPPTANSKMKIGNNIMFRSRNGQECEVLYNLINQARINNPTYIALQNARGPFGGSNWASYMDRKANSRNPSSWWHLGSKKSSYRAGTRRSASIAQTESSVGTMASAFSALRRLSSGSRMFNIGKSTVSSRGGLTRSSTTFTSSSGSSTPVIHDLSQGTPAGITNAKIRLYQRETASKWRDMGSARLTILHPPRRVSIPLPSGHLSQEKRIVIVGATQGETLLDVTLGETSFERVARTGIAVSVWEKLTDDKSEIGKTGGVIPSRIKVFMVQMKSEAETAYTFSLVGRLRY